MHRIGRTGRVGRSGRAITFVESRQKRELRGDREAHRHRDRPVERRRQGRAGAGHRAPAPPRQAEAQAQRRRAVAQAARQRRARRGPRARRSRPRRHLGRRGGRRGDPRRARARALLVPRGAGGRARRRCSSASTACAPGTPCCGWRPSSRDGCALRPACGYGKLIAMTTAEAEATGAEPDERPAGPAPSAARGEPARQAPAGPPARPCGAALAPDQDWCLECGTAASRRAAAPAFAASASPARWPLLLDRRRGRRQLRGADATSRRRARRR